MGTRKSYRVTPTSSRERAVEMKSSNKHETSLINLLEAGARGIPNHSVLNHNERKTLARTISELEIDRCLLIDREFRPLSVTCSHYCTRYRLATPSTATAAMLIVDELRFRRGANPISDKKMLSWVAQFRDSTANTFEGE